ncbi:unnamed protein product [Caenorhabditis sp. 36 PRJEB53466]|nr:unnamed protein product [Caenorhabditis sp. 36 PRJEB53466]
MKFTIALLVIVFVEIDGQWTELEVIKLLEETNVRHAQIEQMTKEAAIRHNQMNPDGLSVSERTGGNSQPPFPPVPVEPPIPAPVPPPPDTPNPSSIPATRSVIRPAPMPTIDDDRTFLAKMSEQEALVNQLNALSAREAATRNGLLVMGETLEGALMSALRPLTMPSFLGQPIPGHFVPFQRMQRPIEQSPTDERPQIQSRPLASQLPMRERNFESVQWQMEQEAQVVLKNETGPAF